MRNMAYSRGLEEDHPNHGLVYIRNEMTFYRNDNIMKIS